VKERTQGLLQRLAKDECGKSGHRITPVVTHQQIADMVGYLARDGHPGPEGAEAGGVARAGGQVGT
jgi:hypothetical protein